MAAKNADGTFLSTYDVKADITCNVSLSSLASSVIDVDFWLLSAGWVAQRGFPTHSTSYI